MVVRVTEYHAAYNYKIIYIISGRNWGKKRLHYFFNNFLLTLRKEPSLGQFSLGLVYLRKSIFL